MLHECVASQQLATDILQVFGCNKFLFAVYFLQNTQNFHSILGLIMPVQFFKASSFKMYHITVILQFCRSYSYPGVLFCRLFSASHQLIREDAAGPALRLLKQHLGPVGGDSKLLDLAASKRYWSPAGDILRGGSGVQISCFSLISLGHKEQCCHETSCSQQLSAHIQGYKKNKKKTLPPFCAAAQSLCCLSENATQDVRCRLFVSVRLCRILVVFTEGIKVGVSFPFDALIMIKGHKKPP